MNQQPEPQLKYPLDSESQGVLEGVVRTIVENTIFDILWDRSMRWMTFFDSLDGFTVNHSGGSSGLAGEYMAVGSGPASGNVGEVRKDPTHQNQMSFAHASRIRTAIFFNNAANAMTNQEAYVKVGHHDNAGYGFKVVDSTLYGVTHDGSSEGTLVLQTGLAIGTTYNLEAKYAPHRGVIFMVNGLEKGVLASNLPSTANVANQQLMAIRIKATAAAERFMRVSFYEYSQYKSAMK